MKATKIAVTVIVIVAAVALVVWRMKPSERGKKIAAQETRRVIDVSTGEAVTVTHGDWETKYQTDPNSLLHKVDETGRKLSIIRNCASCGAEIAQPTVGPGDDYRAKLRDYKCPKCGRQAVSRDEVEP